MSLTRNFKIMEYPKLDPEFKAKWTAELRSGKHIQGEQKLYNQHTGALCCLAVAGVVCGLSVDDMIDFDMVPSSEPSKLSSKYELWKKANECGYPEILREGKHVDMSIGGKLARMNDGNDGYVKTGFHGLADWIDANL